MAKIVHLAMIGVGYWGPNILRSFQNIEQAKVDYVCDLDPEKLKKAQSICPQAKLTENLQDVLGDPQIDAVLIATAAPSHFELASKALLAGKHVFVEKPMTLSVSDAEELIELAQRCNRKLMVGHLLMYHPAVEFLKSYVDSEEFGDLRYIYSTRVNLGKVRSAENALWSLAPHDISVILHLMGQEPLSIDAQGGCYVRPGIEDVVFCSMRFANQVMASVHVSWLDPHKVRRMTIVGSKKMLVFDDMQSVDKIRIYDKSVQTREQYDFYDEEYINLCDGQSTVPSLPRHQPLEQECRHFVSCILNDQNPLSDGHNGLSVLNVLTRAQESLQCLTV